MFGRRVGSWVLERELGRGGMGSVFEARHVSLRTQAAVKVLSSGLESEESFRQRFRREAELQAQLRHANVARVLDYLEDGGQWFLVLEYLDRGSLADLLSRGEKVSRPQAIAWAQQALSGLGHAHQKGIVHRDIKPANLMFGSGGEIVVVDFGIARAEATPGLTSTGMTIGTPQYMSPEQIVTPNQIDGRADMYSLAIVLYEMLAGRRPFDSGSDFSLLQAQVSEPPPPLRSIDPGIPAPLEAVVMRALAKKPEDRYPNCAAMIAALDLPADSIDRTMAVPPVIPMPATVQHSALFERAPVQNLVGPSSGEVRDRKRRAFQWRLMAGAIVVAGVATVLGVQEADWKSAEGTIDVTDTSNTGEGTTTGGGTTTTGETTGTTSTQGHGQSHDDRPVKPDPDHGINSFNQAGNQGQRPFTESGLLSTATAPPDPTPVRPPPPQVPVLPENPRIAIIGTGNDPMLAAALEQEMERRFSSYSVSDERGDPDVDELLGGGASVSPKTLGAQLLKSGFHILILLRAEEGDRRTFEYRGQTGSIKAARVRMNAYLLPANRPLGPGWTELVEYTELSIAAKAKQAFIGATADLRQAIDQDWAQLRASGAAR